jgi:hypothetical protein
MTSDFKRQLSDGYEFQTSLATRLFLGLLPLTLGVMSCGFAVLLLLQTMNISNCILSMLFGVVCLWYGAFYFTAKLRMLPNTLVLRSVVSHRTVERFAITRVREAGRGYSLRVSVAGQRSTLELSPRIFEEKHEVERLYYEFLGVRLPLTLPSPK